MGQFVARKCKLNNGFLICMPGIWPKIAQDISQTQICPRYAQALPEVWGFKLRKWDKMSPGRVHKLGHYVAGEVHNAVGHFVVGTFCLLTFINVLRYFKVPSELFFKCFSHFESVP